MEAFTPRNVAKFVVKTVVAGKASNLAETIIIDHTQFEEDDLVVNISSGMIGWYVSDKLKPITDNMIDKTADWIVARKEKKTQKETAE